MPQHAGRNWFGSGIRVGRTSPQRCWRGVSVEEWSGKRGHALPRSAAARIRTARGLVPTPRRARSLLFARPGLSPPTLALPSPLLPSRRRLPCPAGGFFPARLNNLAWERPVLDTMRSAFGSVQSRCPLKSGKSVGLTPSEARHLVRVTLSSRPAAIFGPPPTSEPAGRSIVCPRRAFASAARVKPPVPRTAKHPEN